MINHESPLRLGQQVEVATLLAATGWRWNGKYGTVVRDRGAMVDVRLAGRNRDVAMRRNHVRSIVDAADNLTLEH